MKNKIRLGNTSDKEELLLDVETLVDTRMVIEANSGGGKSYFMRLLAERTAQAIPFIILDYEGEFSTLREKLDLVLVGTEGEIAADTRSAKLLARKVIETGVSAVIDLYELKVHERQEYARIFLDALINLPRHLWKPYLIFIDEAHKLCPERGDAKATSTQAVIDLMSLGGKRGFCGILATQRFSKLHNNALAEANNFFIGRTVLDADQKRAGDYLGMPRGQFTQLRDVERGNFYAFGPALSHAGVAYFHGDLAETTHLRGAQRREMQPPKPSRHIQAILSQFADLPKKAEEEARTLEEAKARIHELQGQIKKLEKAQPAPVETVTVREVPVITEAQLANLASIGAALTIEFQGVRDIADDLEKSVGDLHESVRRALSLNQHSRTPPVVAPTAKSSSHKPPAPRPVPRRAAATVGESDLPPRMQKILDAIAEFNQLGIEQPSREQVAWMCERSSNSSGYANDLGNLTNQRVLISYPMPGCLALTNAGREAANWSADSLTLQDYHRRIYTLLEPRFHEILNHLVATYPDSASREELAEACGRSSNSSGWANDLGRLRNTLEMIEYPSQGMVRAAELLFPAGLR